MDDVRTLDSLGTFHGLGIIAATTLSGVLMKISNAPIPHLSLTLRCPCNVFDVIVSP